MLRHPNSGAMAEAFDATSNPSEAPASDGRVAQRCWRQATPIREECIHQRIVWSHWWQPKPSHATTAHHRKRNRTQVELRMGDHQVHDHEDGTVQQIDAILHLRPIDLAIPCCPAVDQ